MRRVNKFNSIFNINFASVYSTHTQNKKGKDIFRKKQLEKNNTYVIPCDPGIVDPRRAAIVLTLHLGEFRPRPRPTLPESSDDTLQRRHVTCISLHPWVIRPMRSALHRLLPVSLRNKSARVTSLSRGLTKVHQWFQHRRRFAALRLLLTGHGSKIQGHQWVRVFFSCRV